MYKRKGLSKRQLARDIKKQKEICLKRFLNCVNNTKRERGAILSLDSNEINDTDNFPNTSNEDSIPCLKEELKKWCVKFKPNRESVDSLLRILRKQNLDVPACYNSLIKNPDKIVLRTVAPGQYWHYGIKNQMRKINDLIYEHDKVILDVNIDGLPLFKSSNLSLWPILAKVVNISNIKVFLVGAFLGSKKPTSVENYLHDFVIEVKDLLENGLEVNDKTVKFSLRACIFDAPAKSFVCGIVGHTSFHGCTKCVQVGKKINNVTVFDTKSGSLLTDQDFLERKNLYFHQNYFWTRKTPLEEIGVKMISQIPVDPMHLIDLGVTRKFLMRLIENKVLPCYKINTDIKTSTSNHLISLSSFIPKEFSRKPRCFNEIRNWKAVEYRQFILYTGICVLKNKVHEDVYYTFLLLHCAYRLLCCPRSFIANISTAQDLLESFVENFPRIFGDDSVTYNVHHLLHITSSVKELGIITNFSAYNFENKMQHIKRQIKRPSKILQQLFNKLKFEDLIEPEKATGFKMCYDKIISYTSDTAFLTLKKPNNYCCIAPYTPIQITNFQQDKTGNKFVIGKRLQNLENFFTDPIPSMSSLGISIASIHPSKEEEIFNIEKINCKLLCLPLEEKYLLLPVLHNCT